MNKIALCCLFAIVFIVMTISLSSAQVPGNSKIQTAGISTESPFAARLESLSYLRKPISVSLKDVPFADALKEIAATAEIRFSFSADIIPVTKPVTLEAENVPLADVLDEVLKETNVGWIARAGSLVVIVAKNRMEEETGTIIGKVADARTQQPLPGANVVLEGTSFGAAADAEGNYRIERVTPGSYKLRASVIGYRTTSQEITVAAGQEVTADFFLEETAVNLDEVVVIGYGTTTRRFSTASIATVKAEDIVKQPVNNPLLALAGRVPGVVVQQTRGLPGGAVTVRIQGQNSIAQGSDPLFVIDGVPYPSSLLPNWGQGLLGNGNPFSFVNPGDIESIGILKDADATAIYGSRGANGVVLVTTRKGRAGDLRVNANLRTGSGEVTRRLPLLNTQQYLEVRREAFANDGITPGATAYDINGVWDSTAYTDWQKELIGGTARYSNYDFSVSGGSPLTQYLIGAGYQRETTVFPGDFANEKYSFNVNLNNASADGKLRVQLSGNYLVDNNRLPSGDLTRVAMQLAPNAPPLYNADGTLNWSPAPSGNSTWQNPAADLLLKYETNTTNLVSNGALSYQVLTGLELRSSFGYTNLLSEEVLTEPLVSVRPEQRPFSERSSGFGDHNIRTWIIEPQATYRTEIFDGRLEVLIGTTIHQTISDGERLSASGYNSDLLLENIQSAATLNAFPSTVKSTYKYNALFARMNYIWNDKYIVNLNGRRDGSSRFGPENRFHNFGSLGLAWIFSNESFFKENVPFLTFGKLRGSYGTSGNDQIGDYRFLSLYSPLTANVPVPYQGTLGFLPNQLTNPYLQWEETTKLQVGLEVGFFDDRIMFEANYYRNRSSNQLIPYSLPITAGFDRITTNFPATVQNSGWEFSARTINFQAGDFRWSSSLNVTIPRNELIDFPDLANSTYGSFFVVGEPITIFRGFRLLGVDPQTGLYLFADRNGNPTSSPNFSTDKTAIINTAPTLYGGFQNTFSYAGFQLDFLFQFVKQIGQNYAFGNQPGRYTGTQNIGNQPVWVTNRWRQPGDNAQYQRFTTSFNQQYLLASFSSDAAWSDASYIRLKNLTLSYQLPSTWGLQNMRLYVEGQNLITIINFKGLDPENQALSLPPLRIWTTGIQLTF